MSAKARPCARSPLNMTPGGSVDLGARRRHQHVDGARARRGGAETTTRLPVGRPAQPASASVRTPAAKARLCFNDQPPNCEALDSALCGPYPHRQTIVAPRVQSPRTYRLPEGRSWAEAISLAGPRRRLGRERLRRRLVLGDQRVEVDALRRPSITRHSPATITRSARCAPQRTSAASGSCAPEKRGSSSVNSARSACAARPRSGRCRRGRGSAPSPRSPSAARRDGSPRTAP